MQLFIAKTLAHLTVHDSLELAKNAILFRLHRDIGTGVWTPWYLDDYGQYLGGYFLDSDPDCKTVITELNALI